MTDKDLTISGGPAEIVVDKVTGAVTVAAHGQRGPRTLRLPGGLKPAAPLTRSGDAWTLPYGGGEPLRVELHK